MKSILVHRYRPILAAAFAGLLAYTTAPLRAASDPLVDASSAMSSVGDPLAAPGAAAAALRTPLSTLGDDGKDMKEVKTVTPPEKSPLFDVLLSIDLANE